MRRFVLAAVVAAVMILGVVGVASAERGNIGGIGTSVVRPMEHGDIGGLSVTSDIRPWERGDIGGITGW